eukprot:7167369-Prymnesium_polylepis.1
MRTRNKVSCARRGLWRREPTSANFACWCARNRAASKSSGCGSFVSARPPIQPCWSACSCSSRPAPASTSSSPYRLKSYQCTLRSGSGGRGLGCARRSQRVAFITISAVVTSPRARASSASSSLSSRSNSWRGTVTLRLCVIQS